jgi:hypothetical protein
MDINQENKFTRENESRFKTIISTSIPTTVVLVTAKADRIELWIQQNQDWI